MRFVTLDTETTGMNKGRNGAICDGYRIIEIACVKVVDGALTGRNFHRYVNPGVATQPGALKIHGITETFLKDKPGFEDIVKELLTFIGDSTIVIHNASFDIPFIDQEFNLLQNRCHLLKGRVFHFIDTLSLAREIFPGVSNTLESLCERYGVNGRNGNKHNALDDAIMLAKVAIVMLS